MDEIDVGYFCIRLSIMGNELPVTPGLKFAVLANILMSYKLISRSGVCVVG